MSNNPTDLRYTETHEWVRDNGDGTVTVGISDHAQELLGDVVFVELPEVGAAFETKDACGVVESVKAASDLYCPLAGEVVNVNENLEDAPETINDDAFGEGWIFILKPNSMGDLSTLMDADAYSALED